MGMYWDPVPHIDAVVAALPHELRFGGEWQDRNRLNVPGPFFAAGTDNCWVGRLHAPRHILYGDEDGFESEFVYRQPRDASELRVVLRGMSDDPTNGWARDGDAHWTPALIREWWHDRARVQEWLTGRLATWADSDDPQYREAAEGLRDYRAYLDRELAGHLQAYAYFLDNGTAPSPADRLPAL
jgi:hypothetical protein